MSEPRYQPAAIKPIQWASVRQAKADRWITTWHVDLVGVDPSRIPDIEAAARNDDAEFWPRITAAPGGLIIEVETGRWGMELDYYELTYRLLGLVDAQIGQIQRIEGTPRNWWKPFRSTSVSS